MDDRSQPYLDAERSFAALEQQRLAGQLTEQGYKEALNALRVKDDAGYTWMLQERTGNWYVYREGAWAQATPPGREAGTPIGSPPPPAQADVAPPVAVRSEATAPLPPIYPQAAARTPVYQATPPAFQAAPPVYAAPVQPAMVPPPPPPAAYAAGPSTFAPAAQYVPPVEPIVPEEDPRSARTRRRESRRERRAESRPGCLKITWSIVKWEILWAAAGWLAYDILGQRYPWILIPVGMFALLFLVLYLRRFRRPGMEGVA